jgi:histidine triad (HIT) family protein
MSTIFTKIIKGEIPCYKIAENYRFVAFLDINPLREGHTLIVPRHEVDYFFDQDEDTLSEMIVFAKRVAVGMKQVIPCKRIGVAVVGLEVPHAHLHLVPMDTMEDISFSKPRVKVTPERFTELAAAIAGKVDVIG